MKPKKTLGEFIIENQNQFAYSTGELSRLLNPIQRVSCSEIDNYKLRV